MHENSSIAGEEPLLDVSIASEDQEDESTNWIHCPQDLALSSYEHFNDYRQAGHMCDVEIEVEDRIFRAHKIVLASTIPYFAKMFTTEMIEAQSNLIRMNTIDAETMESILNFVYMGRVQFTSANAEKLLKAADYLQLNILSNRCSEILKSKITEKTVFSIRKFALLYNAPRAVMDADRFIQHYFVNLARTEEFLQLDFQSLFHILEWDQLYVDSEERVFEALMRWLEYDAPTRHVFAPRLLIAVRMPLLRPIFIIDHVSKHPLLWASMECRDLIDEAKNYHLVPERRAKFNTRFKQNIRVCTDMPGRIFALGGINQLQPSPSAVEYYDPQNRKWCLGKSMLTQRTRIGVAVFGYKLFVVGGYNGVERLKSVEVFDTQTNQWEVLPSMIKRRSAMCTIALGEHIYVCGGYDGTHALDSVESFDVRQNKWTARPPMLASRCAAAIAVIKGQIYVIGGHNGVSVFNTMERFDPITERWEKGTPMQQARCRLSATTYQDKIYVVGGYNNGSFVSTAEMYDPETNRWVYIAPMLTNRARVSLVTNGDHLYAIGGYDGEKNLSSMEVYHPMQSRWEPSESMKIHEGGVGCVVVPIIPALKESPKSAMKRTMDERQNGEGPSEKREGVESSLLMMDVQMARNKTASATYDEQERK